MDGHCKHTYFQWTLQQYFLMYFLLHFLDFTIVILHTLIMLISDAHRQTLKLR